MSRIISIRKYRDQPTKAIIFRQNEAGRCEILKEFELSEEWAKFLRWHLVPSKGWRVLSYVWFSPRVVEVEFEYRRKS